MAEFERENPEAPSTELRSARDEVRENLLRDLLHGKIKPLPTEQAPLSENDLAERYGQGSRMPVRMALAVLVGEGLVLQRARRGCWLVQYDERDMEQIDEMRARAEAMVAEALSQIADSEADGVESLKNRDDWQRALRANERMRALSDNAGDEADFLDCDVEFHASLARAGGYDMAARHIVEWSNCQRIYALQNDLSIAGCQEAYDQHERLLDAILRAERQSAVELTGQHAPATSSRSIEIGVGTLASHGGRPVPTVDRSIRS